MAGLTLPVGVDAIAGPLPPPPRLFDAAIPSLTPPPPRPPRLHSPLGPPKLKAELEAVKQALQLPPSVAAKLAKSIPPPDLVRPLNVTQKQEKTPVTKPKTIFDLAREDDEDEDEMPEYVASCLLSGLRSPLTFAV